MEDMVFYLLASTAAQRAVPVRVTAEWIKFGGVIPCIKKNRRVCGSGVEQPRGSRSKDPDRKTYSGARTSNAQIPGG